MSPGGTIPSPLLCVVRSLVPAAAAGDGPRARLGEAEDVARDGLRVLQAQGVRALRALRGPRVGLPLRPGVEGLEPLHVSYGCLQCAQRSCLSSQRESESESE